MALQSKRREGLVPKLQSSGAKIVTDEGAARPDAEVTETWESIAGYEGVYEISDLGRVRSLTLRNNKETTRLRPAPLIVNLKYKSDAYPRVALYRDGICRVRKVHLLVLETFIGPRPHGMSAAHWDGVPTNNKLKNLRWATKKENEADKVRVGTVLCGSKSRQAKFTESQVLEIRSRAVSGETYVSLGESFRVNPGTIRAMVTRQTWKHV